jgi:hypothetical protein
MLQFIFLIGLELFLHLHLLLHVDE